ncbi:MAG: acetamidase/formamidase family protein [Candidatus Solibacter usitatus]|nr:acetamidase/formamidase family protein [Candidatus Solibacter usitatus]
MKIALLFALPLLSATYEVYPNQHSRVFSAYKEPVARIKSGDTVITRTWDSGGADHQAVKHIQHPYVYPESGNPLMGPFYIEDAAYGDSLEVRLDKVRLNRNYGYTSYRLSPAVLDPNRAENLYKNYYKMDVLRPGRADLIPWDLDLRRGVANPRLLEGSGFKFDLPVRPMLGCIGVAPPGEKVETSGPAGSHGGNMDYNDVAEGATLLFPVYHPGAYFYLGDGHALQGDGEGLGSGVETSLDVQFTVRVRKGKRLSIPRLVNEEFIISIASQPEFSSSMDAGVRAANSDMIDWLTSEYKLTHPEAHLLMGTAVQHKIVTYFGTVATLIPRKYLRGR